MDHRYNMHAAGTQIYNGKGLYGLRSYTDLGLVHPSLLTGGPGPGRARMSSLRKGLIAWQKAGQTR